MLKVACVAAIFAVAASLPQGGFSDIGYQFPYSSQSIKLHSDDDEDHNYKHYESEEHHLEVYHPIQEKHEIHEEHNIEPPKVYENFMDLPMIDHKKHMGMPKLHHDKRMKMPKMHHENMMMMHHEMHKSNEKPKINHEKALEKPKMHNEKHHIPMMMMMHEMLKYHEGNEMLKKPENHKQHEEHHEKHEEKHKEEHTKHYHKKHNFHPKYEYDYTVEDPHTGDYKTHHESRHGDMVHGFYTIHEADGTTRIVEYSADQHDGFKASVRHEGQPTHIA